MILLDTNYLIGALTPGSQGANRVLAWYQEDELCTSAIAWYEFLCGPLDNEAEAVIRGLLRDRIIPFNADQAAESSRLFNAVGRIRKLRVDSMIAASAILSNARLATENQLDFKNFESLGLRLL
ncbi:hypothetical protein MASR2M78_30080 [Treponema sp.]